MDNNVGANALHLELAQDAIVKQAEIADVCEEEVKKMDPKATVDTAVALAAPPKETEEQEEVKTIAELLGIDEIQPGEKFEDFVEKVELATGVDVTELETVADKQVEEDKALGKLR